MDSEPSTKVPVIETERLVLRGHRRDDLDAFAAIGADPNVLRFVGGNVMSREDAWRKLLSSVGHWSLMGFGLWGVEEKASGRFMGDVGFSNFNRGLGPRFDSSPEIAWVLASWSHGKGFATEAAKAALQWAEEHGGLRRTVCLIDAANAASLRVAAKCSYVEMERVVYKGSPLIALHRES